MKGNDKPVKVYNVWQPLLLSLMLIVGMLLGYQLHDSDHQISLIEKLSDDSSGIGIGRVEEIIRFIDNKYVEEIDDDALVEELIENVINKLDPHSIYIAPEKLKDINTEMGGAYVGLGIETSFIHDTVRILNVLPDSPAEKAGLKKRDAIISIDDSLVVNNGLTFSEVRSLLRREENQHVDLQIQRRDKKLDLEIQFGEVPVKSVDISQMITDEIGYLRITKFTSKTYKEFAMALEDLYDRQGLKHLIIDVRNNPGGYLPEATNILSQLFKEKGKMLVYTEGRKEKVSEYKTTGKAFFDIGKVVVLIDEGSASGSEILAGAIQDWDRGVIIGRRSFGKGLVQEQYELNNGGAIRLTIAKYYTPSGRSIQRSYVQKDDYYAEVGNRELTGEQYNGIDSSMFESSPTFETKLLQRKILGEGGIYPDIFIPLDSVYKSESFLNLVQYAEGFSFLKSDEVISNVKSDSLFLSNYTVSDELMSDFKNYVFGRGGLINSNELDLYEDELKFEIKSAFAKICFDRIIQQRFLLQTDPFILEALKAIKSKDVFADLPTNF